MDVYIKAAVIGRIKRSGSKSTLKTVLPDDSIAYISEDDVCDDVISIKDVLELIRRHYEIEDRKLEEIMSRKKPDPTSIAEHAHTLAEIERILASVSNMRPK